MLHPDQPLFSFIKLSYGQDTLRIVRNFINERCKVIRFREHLTFNHRCKSEKLVPKPLRVKCLVNTFEGRRIAEKASIQFISARISLCHSTINRSSKRISYLKQTLLSTLDVFTLDRVDNSATEEEEKVRSKFRNTHENKLERLRSSHTFNQVIIQPIDPKWVKNLSKTKQLSTSETAVLAKGLNFAPAPTRIPTAKILAAVEPAIQNLTRDEGDIMRTNIANILLHSHPPSPNLSVSERCALKALKGDPSIVILPADKGRTTVVLDTSTYKEKASTLLSDKTTYTPIKNDPTSAIQKSMNNQLLDLQKKSKLSSQLYNQLRCSSGTIPLFYGLPKIHKKDIPLRPIVSFCSSPTYALSKYLATLLSPLIGMTPYTVPTSESFCNFIRNTMLNNDDTMVSFDVISLFTCIPTSLAISTALDRLKSDSTLNERTQLEPEDICALLQFCLNSTVFAFDGVFYKQNHGTAMGSPVSSVIANLCMESFEEMALTNCNFQIKVWKRYVDDTFVILPASQVAAFHHYLNSLNPHIQFTIEVENNNTLPFLDVSVMRNLNGQLSTTIYRKATHTDRYLDFHSHHPTCHKASVVKTLIKRSSTHCSDVNLKSKELQHVSSSLKINSYPKRFISRQSSISTPNVTPQPKKSTIVLPYIRGVSEQISRLFPQTKFKTFYKPTSTLRSLLTHVKDRTPATSTSNAVYQIPCKNCPKIYTGQTKRTISTRCKDHQRDLNNCAPNSQLVQHAYSEDHIPDFKSIKAVHKNIKIENSRLFLESWETYSIRNLSTNASKPLPESYKLLNRITNRRNNTHQ